VQKITGHHLNIRTANITIKLNIFNENYSKCIYVRQIAVQIYEDCVIFYEMEIFMNLSTVHDPGFSTVYITGNSK